jgi:hypothetical protein
MFSSAPMSRFLPPCYRAMFIAGCAALALAGGCTDYNTYGYDYGYGAPAYGYYPYTGYAYAEPEVGGGFFFGGEPYFPDHHRHHFNENVPVPAEPPRPSAGAPVVPAPPNRPVPVPMAPPRPPSFAATPPRAFPTAPPRPAPMAPPRPSFGPQGRCPGSGGC